MKDEARKHLHDIREAVVAIRRFVRGKSLENYRTDEMLRSAVERKFEIIGEALNRLFRGTPELMTRVRNHRDIISFRNLLAHGYDGVDDRVVWGIVEEDLDALLQDIEVLMSEE